MLKTFFKIHAISLCLIINQINGMSRSQLEKLLKLEEAAIKLAKERLTKDLVKSGYIHGSFNIIVVHRRLQKFWCQQNFCHYPKHVLDPKATLLFADDPTAACLCTRNGKYDTKDHILQANLIKE